MDLGRGVMMMVGMVALWHGTTLEFKTCWEQIVGGDALDWKVAENSPLHKPPSMVIA